MRRLKGREEGEGGSWKRRKIREKENRRGFFFTMEQSTFFLSLFSYESPCKVK